MAAKDDDAPFSTDRKEGAYMKKKQWILFLCTAVLCVLLCAGAGADDIHTWTDDEGIVWSYKLNANYQTVLCGCTLHAGVTEVTIPSTLGGSHVFHIGDRAFFCNSAITSVRFSGDLISIGEEAFASCPNLTTVVTERGLRALGDSAFANCSSLKNVKLPHSGVQTIGEYAFQRCTSLTSIKIPYSITRLGRYAFSGCTALTEVVNMDAPSLTSLENGVFANCPSLNTIELPSTVTSIGSFAFVNCESLESIGLPAGLQDIGDHAFFGCKKLKSVTFPDQLKTIGVNAFASCSSLTVLTFPDSLTTIGERAFEHCAALAQVTFGNSLEKIKYSAFGGCGLTNVTIPDSVTSLERQAFAACQSLTSVTIGSGITDFQSHVFLDCISLTDVTLRDGLAVIGAYTFNNCNALTSVTIPASVKTVENGAFDNCKGLTSVTLSEGIVTLNSAFSGCSGLTSVNVPDSVTTLSGTFYGCSGLASVHLGSHVSVIGPDTFNGCKNLTALTLPDSVTTIGSSAFRESPLTSIDLPAHLETIGISAFAKSGLVSVSIPDSVTGIGNSAFANCPSLVTAHIGRGVTALDTQTFINCSKLSDLRLGSSLTSIGQGAFANCTRLTYVTFPESLESIGDSAFSGCVNLRSVLFPEGLTTIGSSAFSDCPCIFSVNIPDLVATVGDYAFSDCSGLTSVNLGSSVQSIDRTCFASCPRLSVLTVSPGNPAYAMINGLLMNKAGTEIVLCPLAASEPVAIPRTVTGIRTGAFTACKNLYDLYYPGTAAQWESVVSDSSLKIPHHMTVHTLEEQTDPVTFRLAGLGEGDSVTLSDGYGTLKPVTESGSLTIWNHNPQVTVTAGEGRRFSLAVGYLSDTGDISELSMTSPLSDQSGTVIHTLHPEQGIPVVSVSFEEDDGFEAYRLFVNETDLDPDDTRPAPAWSVTSGDQTYGNSDVLVRSSGGIMENKTFTLTLAPEGRGCTGGLYTAGGSLIQAVTDAETQYTFTAGSNITLSLTWYSKAARCAVIYDGNGSDGGMPAHVALLGADVTVAENRFTGNVNGVSSIFGYWYAPALLDKGYLVPGSVLRGLQEDVTLYAQWIPAWKLSFFKNGGSGTMEPILVAQNDSVVLPACGFTNPGKALQEWNTKKSGKGTAYHPGDTLEPDQDISLYAIWADGRTVTVAAGEGCLSVTGSGTYLPDASATVSAQPAEGYRFLNWTDETGAVISTDASYTFTVTADCLLTANFERSSYPIAVQYCTVLGGPDYTAAVYSAQAGAFLFICRDDTDDPEGMYWTGLFSVNGEELESGVYEFTMPEEAVAVAAVFLPQETVTADLSGGSASLPAGAIFCCGDPVYDESAQLYRLDLNGDGTPDCKVIPQESGDVLLLPLQGMTALAPSFTIDISAEHSPWGTVVFRFEPAFGTPDFTLPAGIQRVEAGAFEGDSGITAIDAGHCAFIGDGAFRNCAGLQKILLPEYCSVSPSAFDGCGTVFVFAPAGGETETTCAAIENCVLIPE